jgi:tetratricopeptide (TPR) repeat protein
MPAHIYIRTGDYEAAISSNRRAIAVDDHYLRAHSVGMNYVLLYRAHNIHFLTAAAMMDGDIGTASHAAEELESKANAIVAETAEAEMYLPTRILVLLRFAKWDDVLSLPQPDAKLKGLMFVWHYGRGCAFAAKGAAAKAEAEREAMEATYKQIPAGLAFGMMFNDWRTMHDLAAGTLNARIAAARGDLRGAIDNWRAAVSVQDHMNYDEPPDWYYPVRESLGAALLRDGQAAEAEQVFRDDLQKNPRNPRSLFGLWKSLEAQRKTVDAHWVQTSFNAAWHGGPDQLRIEDF